MPDGRSQFGWARFSTDPSIFWMATFLQMETHCHTGQTPRTHTTSARILHLPEKEAKRILVSLSRYVTLEQDQLAGLPSYVSLVAD